MTPIYVNAFAIFLCVCWCSEPWSQDVSPKFLFALAKLPLHCIFSRPAFVKCNLTGKTTARHGRQSSFITPAEVEALLASPEKSMMLDAMEKFLKTYRDVYHTVLAAVTNDQSVKLCGNTDSLAVRLLLGKPCKQTSLKGILEELTTSLRQLGVEDSLAWPYELPESSSKEEKASGSSASTTGDSMVKYDAKQKATLTFVLSDKGIALESTLQALRSVPSTNVREGSLWCVDFIGVTTVRLTALGEKGGSGQGCPPDGVPQQVGARVCFWYCDPSSFLGLSRSVSFAYGKKTFFRCALSCVGAL